MGQSILKTVLVTGGNRGIGLEVCRQLGLLGYHIFLSARNSDKGNDKVEKLRNEKIIADFIQMDVSNEESIKIAASEFEKLKIRLDVLINNAAIFKDSEITKLSTEEFRSVLNTNSIGAFIVIREFLPFLEKGGRIINVSSNAGALHDMDSYAPAYSISKTTLNAITKQFASALKGKNWVRTDMGGWTATRSVKKGAETIVWLATETPIDKTGLFWSDKKVMDW